jgi:hypothetical protein
MRLLVSHNNNLAEIFRVNFYKSKHWSVIGEHTLFDYLQSFIPTGTNFHSHFIYVETGNYHYSIKYFDTVENLYVDRKTFWNHIAVRKGNSPEFANDHPVERRDREPNVPLDMFMMREPLKPWTEKPFGIQFAGLAVSTTADQISKYKWDDTISVKNEDMVIDLDKNKDRNINFGASIYTKGNPAFDLSKLPNTLTYHEKIITKNDLFLRLHIIVE